MALYGVDPSNAGQKVKVEIFTTSVDSQPHIQMPLNQAVQLVGHADPNANSSGCANTNFYYLYIAPTALVNAKSGHYKVSFSITASNYSG